VYAATAKPRLFHLLWNNKIELFDRTLLMLYYKLLGKRVLFTAHNVNAGKRDLNDSWLNRLSLKTQYRLLDHIFVHTEAMKSELLADFKIPEGKVSVIPFGINNTVPNTGLSNADARRQLGIAQDEKALLFFGNIAPYKGLEYLVEAFINLLANDRSYRLVIVGSPKGGQSYWNQIRHVIHDLGAGDRVIQKIEYVPDETTELYFKAADVVVLPYTHVFQSGVLFLGYSFGLPAIAADVGSLREEIIEGETGFVFKSRDSADLAATIQRYFNSQLFRDLARRRSEIQAYANDRYSWGKVAAITTAVYARFLKLKADSRFSPKSPRRLP
jgi:D-inositol-3-phosphate glycosyltransferase